MKIGSKDSISLNVIRSVAILMVIFVHASGGIVIDAKIGTFNYVFACIIDTIAHLCVPLFVMVSGALMLNEKKEINVKDLYIKKIIPFLLILLAWSIIYAVGFEIVIPYLKGEEIILKTFIESLVFGHYHLWYLYMQIGLYMILPFLKLFVNKKNKNYILLFILISLITQFTLPVVNGIGLKYTFINYLGAFLKQFNLSFFGIYVTYYLTGWYIVNVGIDDKKKRYLSYGTSLISLISLLLYIIFTKDYTNAYEYGNLFIYLYSVGVFIYLSNVKYNEMVSKIAGFISKYSFGIYLVHAFILSVLIVLLPKFITPLYILVLFILTFIISFVGTFILSKIPVLNKLIRM